MPRPLVFTNGVFDVLHAGHVRLLHLASAMGVRLVVGLNSDASVRALGKGPERPIHNQYDRASVLAALASVDAVVVFDEPTPLSLIRQLRPDVLVKADDYRPEDVVGRTDVERWGGRVEIVERLPGRSTTNTLGRIR